MFLKCALSYDVPIGYCFVPGRRGLLKFQLVLNSSGSWSEQRKQNAILEKVEIMYSPYLPNPRTVKYQNGSLMLGNYTCLFILCSPFALF